MEIRKDNLLISDDKTKIKRKKVYQLLKIPIGLLKEAGRLLTLVLRIQYVSAFIKTTK